jgi:hypothetical protein
MGHGARVLSWVLSEQIALYIREGEITTERLVRKREVLRPQRHKGTEEINSTQINAE